MRNRLLAAAAVLWLLAHVVDSAYALAVAFAAGLLAASSADRGTDTAAPA
jgi:hypothetical protein